MTNLVDQGLFYFYHSHAKLATALIIRRYLIVPANFPPYFGDGILSVGKSVAKLVAVANPSLNCNG